jgi:hypothetical protein
MRAAGAQWQRRARGAHATPYHGPLQLRLMRACHRTSPIATSLGADGLYSATDAEQRGQHDPKLMSSPLATAPAAQRRPTTCTLARPTYGRMTSTTRDRVARRASCVRAAETKTLPNSPKPATLPSRTRQRRSPSANKRNASRQRRVNEESPARAKTPAPMRSLSFGSGRITPRISDAPMP